MDGNMAPRQPVRLVNLIEEWRERAAIKDEELRQAAERWGVRREHPEAAFVDTLIASHSELGEVLAAFAGDMEIIVQEARKAAEAEFARHHSAREDGKFILGQARGAIRDIDVEKTRMADEMLVRAIPQLVKGVKDAVAVREVWVARGRSLRQAMLVAAATVAVFVGGYSWRTAQVWPVSDAALRNSEGIESCKATSHYVDEQGNRLCRLDAFTASKAEAK